VRMLRGSCVALLLGLCLVIAAFGGRAEARSFTDVGQGDWFAPAVGALSDVGVIGGYPDGSFQPYEIVTRAEFSAMLARAVDSPQASSTPFQDISPADWYFGSVAGLYDSGLVTGLTATSFGPDRGMERAQVATLVVRALAYRLAQQPQPGISLDMTAAEVEAWNGAFRDRWFISSPHDKSVAVALRLGIVTGFDDSRYYPMFTITRAQAAAILYRAFYTPLSMRSSPSPAVSAEDGYGNLAVGSRGPLVLMLERRLAALKYDPGTVDDYFDTRTEAAVIAFQKAEGLSRTGKCGPEVWKRLGSAQVVTPRYHRPGVRVEVDLTRQILILLNGDSVLQVLRCSTGRPGLDTPPGNFRIQWKVPGWRESTLGFLYKPSYFFDGMAIHGGYTINVYPSSHGCVRVSMWDADELYPQLPVGTHVDIYY
jgi:N-acetylmuramoyl-L-alanine amidase